jgi:O-antigen/teichoic acid export membrane protein
MAKQNPLIKNTFLYALGPLLSRVISIALIPFYSFYLQTGELGYYDLVVTTGSLVMALATLKISDAVYRWLVDCGSDDAGRRSAVTNSMVVLLAGMGLIVIGFLLVPQKFRVQYSSLVCAYILSTVLFSHLQQVLRGLGYMKMYVWLSVANCLMLLVANVVFLWILRYRLDGVLLSAIAANVFSIAMIAAALKFSKYIHLQSVSRAEIKKMLGYSTPLVFNALNWWLMGGFDRIIIAAWLGYDANGVYAVANKFASIMVLLNSFFIPAWQDFILANAGISHAQQQFNRYFNRYIVLQLSLVAFLCVAGKFAVLYFIDAGYAAAWQYLPLLLAATCFLAYTSFLGSFFLLKKNTAALFTSTLIGSVVNIAVSLLLINRIGLYAPCIGMCAGFAVTFLLRYKSISKTENLSISYAPVLLLAGCFALVVFCLFNPFSYSDVIALVVSFAVLIVMNKTVILSVVTAFKKSRNAKNDTVTEELIL